MSSRSKLAWAVAILLFLPLFAISQASPTYSSLVLAGHQGTARVIQSEGRNYVEIEGLARLSNSSISFRGNQIVLALPGTAAETPKAAAAPATGFSRDFTTSAIETMTQLREWHAALRTAIERNYPISDDWLGPYRARAQQTLLLASASAKNPSDQLALPLLTSGFNNMSTLNDKYVNTAKSFTYIPPDSLTSDSLDQKLINCGRSFAAMVTSNQFVDDGTCQ